MAYLPQWKARLRAIVLCGEKSVLKKRGGRCYVCVPNLGRLDIHGEGSDWESALADAERRQK